MVALGMSSLMKIKPRVGWVRADQVADESAAQEILRLRKTVDELAAHIAQTELTAPPGTAGFAQGDETISLNFRYEVRSVYSDATETFVGTIFFQSSALSLLLKPARLILRKNSLKRSRTGSKISSTSKFLTLTCGMKSFSRLNCNYALSA